MIDWGKIGPANAPTPATPDTTAPVAPSAPGSMAAPAVSGLGGLAPTPNITAPDGAYHEMTQGQVDALDPGQRIGRGFDNLGQALFGRGNGSLLGGVPLLGDIIGGAGNAVHGLGDLAIIKPIEGVATVASHVPLGWLPGGADESFTKIGTWAQSASPEIYAEWQKVNAAANGDVLGGGNLKADFNIEVAKMLDDSQHDSQFGSTPVELQMGREGIGSLGGALSHAITGFLGLAGANAQRGLGGAGVFDPGGVEASYAAALQDQQTVGNASELGNLVIAKVKSGAWTSEQADAFLATQQGTRNRVQESAARLDAGGEISDVEKHAVEAWRSGGWSMDHAQDYIVQHGQSITRNPIGQALGSVVTDPLTFATIGAGSIAKAGKIGTEIIEAGSALQKGSLAERVAAQATMLEKYQVAVATVQQSQLGPAFRIARGLIDPLAVYKPNSVARATTDLLNGSALTAFDRTYGPGTIADLRRIGREAGMTYEMDSDIASYSIDQANLMVARKVQKDALQEGLGIELMHSNVDDVIEPIAGQAGRDAITELTDHMLAVSKNTFTAEEEANLGGRVAAAYGGDPAEWTAKVAGMSDDLKRAMHAVTYKRAEVEFEKARALVNEADYAGALPLRNMVLMSTDTLDNVVAESVIANIRAVLKNEAKTFDQPIKAATDEWNAMARRYPALANIGHAPGGQEQLEQMVKELEKQLERGGISRRALDSELNDPILRPVRDMLDRHSLPGEALTPDDIAMRAERAAADARHAVEKAGFTEVSNEKFFAAIRKATKVVKSNGRSVGETVYTYPKGEYRDMKLFLSADGKTGFAIKPDGDLVSVFNVGEKGAIQKVIPYMHGLGATKLDAFDEAGRLPELYGKGGFKEVGRDAWNPDYAPDPWTGGTPDVVYMAHPGDAAENGVKRLWNVGFRADEEVAWGLKQDINTGRYIVDRDPTISHVVNAVPGRQRFSDTTRNVLGQTIGKSGAERLNRPIESIEAFANTMRDGITGRRLTLNIERRYEKIAFDAGIPKPIAKEIFKRAREVAGLDFTTVRGIKPGNLWKEVHDLVPSNLVLKDGSTLNVHVIMSHLLEAAEGDLRVMGVTSVLSQRMRNAIRKGFGPVADPQNWAGQMTVTMYNKLRYSQPMFLIQRVTDAPYYSILYGVTPVGTGALKGENAATRIIEENLGRTGMARDFSMDMPEYATRTNFTEGIKTGMQQAGLLGHRFDKILTAPDTIIANNMTNMLYARWGDIVKGALDNLATAAERGDPALKAEMLAAGDGLSRSFADWRQVYSDMAGRVLDDNEVGLRYVQDQLNSWRRHVVTEEGKLDFSRLVAEGERSMPNTIGEIGPIKPDVLAEELGYADAAALRRDVTGHMEKINGEFVLVKGASDIAELSEKLRTQLGAHPDYVRRAAAYFGETWDDFWSRLALPSGEGGLDISSHYAKEAQDFIAMEARSRGMDPWEYLSGVMASNIGAKDIETHIGQLMSFLKAGKATQPIEEWSRVFRGTLDVSAQKELLGEFEKAGGGALPQGVVKPAQFTMKTPKSAPGAKARPPVAGLPDVFKAEPGYAYRVETAEAMGSGLPKGLGVTTGAPTPFYAGKDGVEKSIFRIADDGSLAPGRAGGIDRLTTKAVKPEDIEILAEDGTWQKLAADPADNYFANEFPELVRNRILDGTPHPNPEVEGYIQQFSKWVNDAIKGELGGQTRSDLRRLVQDIPHTHAVPYNRSHGLVVSLLKDKISDAQQDIFRLAEMQTKRNLLERSMNHPLFGLYPSSYMWGKVLPETVKFLAKNPYAATYTIANVQRSIAIQREYDHDIEDKISAVDRSAGAFLLDYITPGLPWSDHSARMSPMVRDLFAGKGLEKIWSDELATVSPDRWIRQFISAGKEIGPAIESLGTPPPPPSGALGALGAVTQGAAAPTAAPTGGPDEITGPTKGAALGPILQDDMTRLQSILLGGQSAEK